MPRSTSAKTLLVSDGTSTPKTSARAEANARAFGSGTIAELIDGRLDLAAQILRNALRLAQGAGDGDGADAGLARDIGDRRTAAATARARFGHSLAPNAAPSPKRGHEMLFSVFATVAMPTLLTSRFWLPHSSGVAQP